MAGRSTIDQLDPAILAEVHAAIERRQSIDDIVQVIRSLGAEASRSAVGRYAKSFNAIARQQREVRSIAEAFGKEFGSDDGQEGRLMIQLIQSMVTRATMSLAQDDVDEIDPKDLHYFARSAKDLISAAKIDVERETKIREEAKKAAREQAAIDAVSSGRSAGASEATLDTIRRRILGLV